MPNVKSFPVTKVFLYTLIGSILIGAILGIASILWGNWGWLEGRVLLTAATIAASSICGMACGAYWSTSRGRLVPGIGIALTILGAVLVLTGIWGEIHAKEYWKTTASIAVFSVALGHLSLLSIA